MYYFINLNKLLDGAFLKKIIPLSTLLSIVDLITLFLLFNVIKGISNDNLIGSSWLYNFGNLFISIFFLFLIRVVLLIYSQKQIHSSRHILSKKIFTKFLFKGSLGSSKSMSNVSSEMFSEVEQVVNSFINPINLLIQSLLTLSVLTIYLFILDKSMSFWIIFSFIFIYSLMFLATNKISKIIAKRRLEDNEKRFKTVDSSVQSLQSIMVYNVQKRVLDEFSKSSKQLSNDIAYNFTIGLFPKYLLEFLILVGIGYFVLAMSQDEIQTEFLMVLAVSSIKLLPAFQGIFSSLNSMRFGYPSLITLIQTLEQTNSNKNSIYQTSENDFINLKIFEKRFRDKVVIKNLEIKLQQRDLVFIYGPSGSGKSTLLNILLMFDDSFHGKYEICKTFQNVSNFKKAIGFVSQDLDILEGSIKDNIDFKRELNLSDNQIISLLKKVGLIDFNVDDIHRNLKFRGAGLSGGQKQRLAIARALANNPQILILDEPTSSLDNKTESKIFDLLEELSKKILVIAVTHSKENVEKFNARIIRMEKLNEL